jgi:TatD DNase family protein
MNIIDSHAHLDFDSFNKDLDEVLSRAWDSGICNIVTISSSNQLVEAQNVVNLAASDRRIWATVGVHPHEADLGIDWDGDPSQAVLDSVMASWKKHKNNLFDCLSMLMLHPKVVAVGEVGLDYHYDHSPRQLQQELFRSFIRLAKVRKLPLVVHSREADDDTIKILQQENAQECGGVLHCFSGSSKLAKVANELGFYFGLAGPLTFKNAVGLRQEVRRLPLDRLMVETDCPYLAPVPYRGKRNEPAYVRKVLDQLAEIKGKSLAEIAEATTENAKRLFQIDRINQQEPGRIVYPYKDSLYVNITNRCTLSCSFCLKHKGHSIAGMSLAHRVEPSVEEIIAALDEELNQSDYREVVFCGIGESLLRLDDVVQVGRWLKEHGQRVRVNTDGLACLVHQKDILAELVGSVDRYNVSLNAHDAATYFRLCPSAYGEQAFEAVCDFIKRAKEVCGEVQATVVEVPGVDVEKAKELAHSLGASFRVRPLVR